MWTKQLCGLTGLYPITWSVIKENQNYSYITCNPNSFSIHMDSKIIIKIPLLNGNTPAVLI